MKPVVGYNRVLLLHNISWWRMGGARGFMLGNVNGRALGLIIASKIVIIDGYIVKAPQRVTLTLFRNIKTA